LDEKSAVGTVSIVADTDDDGDDGDDDTDGTAVDANKSASVSAAGNKDD
jgi:hypothetical protein